MVFIPIAVVLLYCKSAVLTEISKSLPLNFSYGKQRSIDALFYYLHAILRKIWYHNIFIKINNS